MSETSERGAQSAYGRRRPLETKARITAYRMLRVAGSRYQRAFPDYLEFAPGVRDELEFADLSARVNCYLRGIDIPLYLPGPRFALRPELVPHFDSSLVVDPGWVDERPDGDPQLVVHRVTPESVRRIASSRSPAWTVAETLSRRSEERYFDLRNAVSWPTYEPVEVALSRLRERVGAARDAVVLATGPSASLANLDDSADVRITCNSAVRDQELIRRFRPNIICFTDPVFHFGPSRYAAEFRRDAVRAAEDADALIVCGHRFAGALLDLEPALHGRLVVIPQQDGGPWRWPTHRNPTVRQGGNVMTTLMLPVAFLLADRVTIAGADGRQPTEKYFWRHNPQLQYSDEMMKTVFDSHPSFFRYIDYRDYYDDYCRSLEDLIQVGEQAGKVVSAITPSWIPALRRRGAAEPVSGDTNSQPQQASSVRPRSREINQPAPNPS
jgi:hypothetical protein